MNINEVGWNNLACSPAGILLSAEMAGLHGSLIHPTRTPPTPDEETMAKRTAHQEKIIRRYYENKDDIMLQKLGELVTDLYLAEGKAKQRIWDRIAAALKNLSIPESQIDHLVKADNPLLVANLVKELLAKK